MRAKSRQYDQAQKRVGWDSGGRSAGEKRSKQESRKDRAARGLRAVIDDGISRVRMTWAKLEIGELHGSYGKRHLLQTIYTVYCDWQNQGRVDLIWRRLASRLKNETIDPAEHVVSLLIKVALPEVRENVVGIWVNAILYGEARHVRPFKLRSFFHVKGGLVRCARLYADDQQRKRVAEGIATSDEQDRREGQAEQARQARRRRSQWTMPDGMRSLYGP